jgi:hypothetical protein
MIYKKRRRNKGWYQHLQLLKYKVVNFHHVSNCKLRK